MRPDIVALLYGLTGLLFIAIGIPLALERVPPNHWYGFRTAKTLSNQTIWYAANRVAGIDLIIAGVAIALGMLAMFILRETMMPALPIARWGFGLFIVATTGVVLHGFWFLSRV
ncbi:MAG: SdpI family protein [Methylocella sp.]